MKISESRLLEWWEAPGIDGREAFDEEILYLNSAIETINLPRWAVLVRDLMPRWGFEPCSHRFFEGLEQVMGMIGAGRACSRLGDCGDVPLSTRRQLTILGGEFLSWAQGESREVQGWLREGTPARREAAQALGEALLSLNQGRVALDETLEVWSERARFPLTQALLDGDDAPLPKLLRHPCSYNLLNNVENLAQALAQDEIGPVAVCGEALCQLPHLAPQRLSLLWDTLEGLGQWLQNLPPRDGFQSHIYSLLGPRDEVRTWLVSSLYKSLKLWQSHLDKLLHRRHRFLSLI